MARLASTHVHWDTNTPLKLYLGERDGIKIVYPVRYYYFSSQVIEGIKSLVHGSQHLQAHAIAIHYRHRAFASTRVFPSLGAICHQCCYPFQFSGTILNLLLIVFHSGTALDLVLTKVLGFNFEKNSVPTELGEFRSISVGFQLDSWEYSNFEALNSVRTLPRWVNFGEIRSIRTES